MLARTLPAATLLAAGLPVLASWGLDGNGDAPGGWLPFAPALLMGAVLILQQLAQAPRPGPDRLPDRRSLRRWLAFTAASGRLPEDPPTRVAAGALACAQLETAVLTLSAVTGMVAAWFLRPAPWWAVTALLLLPAALLPLVRARRAWRYLEALHGPTTDRR